MPDLYRVEIVHYLQGALPKDKWVNVLYIEAGTDDPQAVSLAMENIFFNPTGYIYGQFYGDINVYNLTDPEPRPIRGTTHVTPASPISAAGLMPEQVALCLSYYATRNLPSQRGRMYIGPWVAANMTGYNIPSATIIAAVAAIGPALLAYTGGTWCQYSQKLRAASPVTDGWVDNEWDTQRRRLTAATARSNWS